jgi:tight adherence protein C
MFTPADLLAYLLILGGASFMAASWRMRRDAVAGRVELIAAVPVARRAQEALPGQPLARTAGGGMAAAEQAQLIRICGRFRIPPAQASAAFSSTRLVLVFALALLGLVLARVAPGHPGAGAQMILAAAFGAAGWIAPAFVLRHAARRHAKAVTEGLPEALELLVICVEAGLSLEDGIDRITGELRWSQPDLAEELMLTSADLKILSDRDQALGNLARRIDTPSVRSVVTALSQTLRYGTPLAQALRVTAAELRNDALMRMEERANRLPSLLTVPMMLFIMPTIFMIIGGPAVLTLLTNPPWR